MNKQPLASQSTQKAVILLRLYFILVILGGLLALWTLLRIPGEVKNIVVFGLSKERLVMAAGILLVILGASYFLISSWLRKSFFAAFQEKLTTIIRQKSTWGWIIFFSTLGLLISSYLILQIPEITEPFTKAYFERMLPLLIWFALLCGQTLLALPLLRYDFNLHRLKPESRMAYSVAIIFVSLLVLWLIISLTGLGVTATDAGAGWNYLGSPILETQAFLAWGVGLLYIILTIWCDKHSNALARIKKIRILKTDLVFSILIWLFAFLLWNSTPLLESWFAASPRPPNQVFYPNSDASTYDTTGQTLLVGVGFKTHDAPFAVRPMYALFLAALHSIGGVEYEPILWMQVAVLALMPVLLYWITRQLHTRVSALIAAFLLIFRETNAIALGGSITTSHAKLLMSDLPTTFGVLLFILLMILWLQNPAQRQTLTLIAGGVTGAFMLIRPEFAVLLPFVGFLALLQLIRQPRVWFKGMLLITVGTVLMLLPWIWRNYQITGTIFLDSPHYRADLIALRYRESESDLPPAALGPGTSSSTADSPGTVTTPANPPTATPAIVLLPGESREEFAKRLTQDANEFARNNPEAVLRFIGNHFFNSQIQTVLYLPGTFRLPESALGFLGHKDLSRLWQECCSADDYIRRLPFWFKWDGRLPPQTVIPLFLNLFLISVGLASAWKNNKFIGLIPLAASLGYTLINSLVRNSGGRYILAIDWVGMLYYAIGLGHLTLWVISYFRAGLLNPKMIGEIRAQPKDGDQSLWRAANLWAALGILLLGCVLPFSEKIIPPRYSTDPQQIQRDILALPDSNKLDGSFSLISFLESGGSAYQGRALYPRFYPSGYENSAVDIPDLPELSHISFYLVGPYNGRVVMFQEAAPETFPNGSDVLLIGCRENRNFDALAVAIYDERGNLIEFLQREPLPEGSGCPMKPP